MSEAENTDKPRIPPAVDGLQVNFCKNPACANFGVPPLVTIKGLKFSETATPKPGQKRSKDSYTPNSSDGHERVLCHECGDKPPLKSNSAVIEEFERMWAYLEPIKASCPDPACINHGKDVKGSVKSYYTHSTTKAGSKRFRCRACGKTFSIKQKSILRQRKSHDNKQLFMQLVNKSPFNRIFEVVEVGSSTLYSRIDFFHRQCLAFAAKIERDLPKKKLDRLYISVDRQEYTVNWTKAEDRRNIRLHAIASADNRSGYVFGMHLNFDPRFNPDKVEADAIACGDYDVLKPFRKHSRLWLSKDYDDARQKAKSSKKKDKGPVLNRITAVYDDASQRDDVEVFETHSAVTKLPATGMLVHAEYTIYGHFVFLHKLLGGVKRVRFFIEQESSMRAACFAAFHKEVLEKRCDLFYVRINKEMTVNDKRRKVAEGKRELEYYRNSSPHLEDVSDRSLRVMMIESRILNKDFTVFEPFKDRYMLIPAPSMNEPEKAVSYLSALDGDSYKPFHLARLYSHASLHGVDAYFELVRRRISLLERPISSSSNAGAKWSGYSPYRPDIIIKMLDILRVYLNFVKITSRKRGKGKGAIEKKTPAMRLGIIDRPVKLEEILYYVP